MRGEREADRIDGIMRDGETRYVEVANLERTACLKFFDHGRGLAPIDETRGAAGDIDRKARFRAIDQGREAVGVIRVFMGYQNGAESVNVFSNGSQTLGDFAAA